jgi:hypothetical protein
MRQAGKCWRKQNEGCHGPAILSACLTSTNAVSCEEQAWTGIQTQLFHSLDRPFAKLLIMPQYISLYVQGSEARNCRIMTFLILTLCTFELSSFTLKMGAASSSETSKLFDQTTRRHIPENRDLDIHLWESLKSSRNGYLVHSAFSDPAMKTSFVNRFRPRRLIVPHRCPLFTIRTSPRQLLITLF